MNAHSCRGIVICGVSDKWMTLMLNIIIPNKEHYAIWNLKFWNQRNTDSIPRFDRCLAYVLVISQDTINNICLKFKKDADFFLIYCVTSHCCVGLQNACWCNCWTNQRFTFISSLLFVCEKKCWWNQIWMEMQVIKSSFIFRGKLWFYCIAVPHLEASRM